MRLKKTWKYAPPLFEISRYATEDDDRYIKKVAYKARKKKQLYLIMSTLLNAKKAKIPERNSKCFGMHLMAELMMLDQVSTIT